jgi:hypothetical protein
LKKIRSVDAGRVLTILHNSIGETLEGDVGVGDMP